jgi:hypothetical protein
MLLPREFGELVAELNNDGLPHVVVGGVAVNLLGYERVTGDVDVLVPAGAQQGAAIRALLDRLGATRPDGSPLPPALFDGRHHIRALTALGVIDFIPEGEPPLDFDSVNAAATADELHGVVVRSASLAHVVALKRLAGRPQDREDLAALEQAYGSLPELGQPG